MSTDGNRLNPAANEAHRHAQQAMIAAREFWGRGDDEAGDDAFEAALSHYLRAGLNPLWVDGGFLNMTPNDIARPRGLVATSWHDEENGQLLIGLTPDFVLETDVDESDFILAEPSAFVEVDR